MTVIDCDSHVMEPADLWLRYLEPKYRDRAIRIEEDDGVEKLIIGEKVVLERVLAGLGGAHIDRVKLFTGGLKYVDGCPPASYEPHARAQLLDEWGVDRGVLFPTIGILPFPTEDVELANAYCRAYNSWQADFFRAIPDRVVPIAAVNWFDVDEAAKELDRCLKLGFRGLFVPPETVGDKRPGDAHFDPIWARLQDAGVPGCLHVIVRFEGAAIPFSAWHKTGAGPVFGFGLGATGQLIPAMASLVLDLLFERFPTLKIVSVEAGCGYAALPDGPARREAPLLQGHGPDQAQAERVHPQQLLLRRRTRGAQHRCHVGTRWRRQHPVGQRLPARGLAPRRRRTDPRSRSPDSTPNRRDVSWARTPCACSA